MEFNRDTKMAEVANMKKREKEMAGRKIAEESAINIAPLERKGEPTPVGWYVRL